MNQVLANSNRIPGCESTNHTVCWGALWACEQCEKRVCYQEGTESNPELCDDCWVVQHNPSGNKVVSAPGETNNDTSLQGLVREVLQEFTQASIMVIPVWTQIT